MSRKDARDTIFKLVYERSIIEENNDFSREILTQDMDDDDKKYVESVFSGIVSHWDFLQNIIENYSRRFKIDRVYKVDLSLLSVAAYEILFIEDLPFKVAINEAIELCKKYSTEKSYKFVNGILSSVVENKEQLLSECGSGFPS